MSSVALHATSELVPESVKGPVKPIKLTYLFDAYQVHEESPYGNTTIKETGVVISNEEYFIGGAQVTYKQLSMLVRTDYPNLDLEEELERLYKKALANY